MCWRRQDLKLKQAKPTKPVLYCLIAVLILVACSSNQTTSNDSPTATEAEPQRPAFVTAVPDAANVQLIQIAEGFDRPLFLTHAGDSSDRLFVAGQTGIIYVIEGGEVLAEPFLDISQEADWLYAYQNLTGVSENGLLGLAFHPAYEENGYFFVYYTDEEGDSVLARYRVSETDPNRADSESGQEILTLDQPGAVHNGGMLVFGPDGYLYLGVGDGGDGFSANGQDLGSLFGSILRLDVSVAETAGYLIPTDNPFVDEEGAQPEIWAYGLRNPWRFSFDRVVGDLWIGDVGERSFEEVDYQPANSEGGENYGWADWEGFAFHGTEGEYSVPFIMTAPPVFVYSHEHGISITGGYVYRGDAISDLYGVYLFSDFGSGQIWTIYRREDGGWQVNDYLDTDYYISSFGEDEAGELYLVNYFEGNIWKFVPQE